MPKGSRRKRRSRKPAPTVDETYSSGPQTKHIVQAYREVKNRGLVPVDVLAVLSADAAQERAERLFETGRYAGADAFTTTGDPGMGDYGEPEFHVRLGRVPRIEE